MRNSECGMRNRSGMSRDTIPTLTFRIPHSAFRILVLLAACTPITTRPDFRPDPLSRPRYDPSRPERDLEVIASKEHEGYKIAQRLVDKLKQKFGVPKAAQEEGRPTPPPSPSPTPP